MVEDEAGRKAGERMIPRKYTADQLIGRKCRPTCKIRNGSGGGVTQKTICTIVNVTRGSGIAIVTEPCACCGQYAYIRGVNRNDLDLINEAIGAKEASA